MDPGISIITLGVSDLSRSIISYRDGLGLPTTFKEGDNIAFFQLKGTWLALSPSDALAEDACLPPQHTRFGGKTLAHNVHRKDEADKVISQALAPVRSCSNRQPTLFGEATPAIFPTRMVTLGKWPGTHSFHWIKTWIIS